MVNLKEANPTLACHPGLNGITASETRLSDVDGKNGRLLIGGYPIEEIAPKADFLEVAGMLFHGERMNGQQLADFQACWKNSQQPPKNALEVLRDLSNSRQSIMGMVRGALAAFPAQVNGNEIDDAVTIASGFPVLVGNAWRLHNGQKPVWQWPEAIKGPAELFLYVLNEKVPSEHVVKALTKYMNTVIDHGLNASTFTARVITSTDAPLAAAIQGALGALEGPRHGGAPGPALEMVKEIECAENAEKFIRRKLEKREYLMGFGHAIYKVRDPRADVLGHATRELYENGFGNAALYELAMSVEKTALRLLDEYKPGRGIRTNVEFYTALLLDGLGLPTEMFTPVFAMSRVVGWLAHCLEQRQEGKLIRPGSRYVGSVYSQWA